MAEINNVIAEASQDLQTIEDFVNLPADSEVYPRLLPSVNVGTLAGTRQAIFEAGGLPAVPFATKALMTASALVDGKYAVVTNDANSENNGLFLKKEGGWLQSDISKYSEMLDLFYSFKEQVVGEYPADIEILDGVVVETYGIPIGKKAYRAGVGYKSAKINVNGVRKMTLSGIIDTEPTWNVVFADSDDIIIKKSNDAGNGDYLVPHKAVWAYKTVKAPLLDHTGIEVNLLGKGETLSALRGSIDDVVSALSLDSGYWSQADYSVGTGVPDSSPQSSNVLVYAHDPRYKHVIIDVSQAKKIRVENSILASSNPSPSWVFVDESLERKIAIVSTANSTDVEVPHDAFYALRTFAYPKDSVINIQESSDVEFYLLKQVPVLGDIYKQVLGNTKKNSSIADDVQAIKSLISTSVAEDEIKKSGLPRYKVSDFEGIDSHEKIDNAMRHIKLSGGGVLDLESGLHIRRSAILMPSNCWLYLNDATLKLADGVFDTIIRNDGIVPSEDYSEPATELNENRNIRIFGNGVDRSAIEGSDVPYKAVTIDSNGEAVDWTGDWYGWKTLSILFANVKDYKIHDFKMSKTKNWAISQEHGCEDFEVYNLEFDTRGVKNGDGVDVRKGCRNGYIHDISGYTADDMIACTALNEFALTHPKGNYLYPMQVGGYIDRGFGIDIENITISNISGGSNYNGVRLLVTGGSKIKDIRVSDISDANGYGFRNQLIVGGAGYGRAPVMGDISNITGNSYNQAFKPPSASGKSSLTSFSS